MKANNLTHALHWSIGAVRDGIEQQLKEQRIIYSLEKDKTTSNS
jgi:hypothetical protein